jgi:hypothetical protein
MRTTNTSYVITFLLCSIAACAAQAAVRPTLRGLQPIPGQQKAASKLRKYQRKTSTTPEARIVGGTNAAPGQYPYYGKLLDFPCRFIRRLYKMSNYY